MRKQLFIFAALWAANSLYGQETPVTPITHDASNKMEVKGEAKADAAEAAENARKQYIDKFKGVAMREMERVGIPASIKLAQGMLESNGGESEVALAANNHFGIKCGANWDGKSYEKQDDDTDAEGKPIKSCFRKYENVEESFFDHSEFLRDPRKYYRYGFLFGLDKQDYKAWAKGLESAGYATGEGYADKLITVIERYQLHLYDRPDLQPGASVNSSGAVLGRIGRINDVKVVLSRENETLDDIARMFRLSPNKVADYNDRGYTPGKRLPVNTRIFIQEKRSKWRGRTTHHFVRESQTMFDVSQQYGVQLESLLKRNGLRPGQEPEEGERVRLKGKYNSKENIRIRTDKPDETKPGPKPSTVPGDQPKMAPTDEELFVVEGGAGQTQPATTQPATTPATTPASGSGRPPATGPATTGPATTSGANGRPATTAPSTTDNNPFGSTPTRPVDPGYSSGSTQTAQPQPGPDPAGYHTVVKGDTLFSLSRKYKTSVADIKRMNNLGSDGIKIGQRLKVL